MQTLLTPISEAAPCGADLSFSSEFDAIADLRRFDDPTLDQGEWVRDIKLADYAGVQRLCTELLTTRTKDLRLAGWLTDALARTTGFAGMAEGLNLCAGLCETFWEELYPQPDEDGFEQRVGNLTWLMQQLADVAQTQPLVEGKTAGTTYGFRVIEAVRARQGSEHDAPEGPTEESINLALTQTSNESLLASLHRVEAALAALAQLQTVIDVRLGTEGPNFSVARDALQNTQHMLTRFAKDRGLLKSQGAVQEATETPSTKAAKITSVGEGLSGAPTSREQALAQLRAVAEFFRRTEPHSPVAYLADKAARWGEIPLHQWLRSVMKDQTTLAQLEELLGIEPPSPDA